MDGYYQAQVSMPYYKGVARQRGRGLGAIASTVGRTAFPIFKKFILPAIKSLAPIAAAAAAPELLEVARGRTKPKAAFKRVATKTIKSQLGMGKKKKKVTRKRKPVKRRPPIDILRHLA